MRPTHRPRSLTRPRAALGVAASAPLAAVLLLAGCASGSSGAMDSGPVVGVEQAAPSAMDGAVVGESAVGAVAADRSVITTGWVTVLVGDPTSGADDAIRIVESSGGRVDGRSESAPTDYAGGSATLTLRIPAERMTEVLDELEALGDLQEVSISATDVTLQVQDLDARITAMRASIDRLEALLAQATDIDALISLETAISDRQAQLESMLAEQRWNADQVAMSTITLQLVTAPVVEEPAPGTFLDGLAAGWHAFVGFLGGLLVAIGFLLPWLVLIGIIGLVVLLAVRGSIRRSRRTATTAPEDVTPAGPAAP